jgi:hypothetical protein
VCVCVCVCVVCVCVCEVCVCVCVWCVCVCVCVCVQRERWMQVWLPQTHTWASVHPKDNRVRVRISLRLCQPVVNVNILRTARLDRHVQIATVVLGREHTVPSRQCLDFVIGTWSTKWVTSARSQHWGLGGSSVVPCKDIDDCRPAEWVL